MKRAYFPVSVSGGNAYKETAQLGDDGQINQLRWYHAGDTGQIASIELSVLPNDADTGPGFQVYSESAINLATQFLKAPRQPAHAVDGTDTGVDEYVPFVFTGKVQLTVTPADTGVVLDGQCYVW